MAQQDGSTTTTRGQPVPQTKDLEDNEVILASQDMINNGEIVTSTAALDSDVIHNSNVMDNTTADFLPQQYIPPQHNHVDPKINFRAQNSQDNEFPQRSDYNLFTQADFPPLPSRFQPVTQQTVEINSCLLK